MEQALAELDRALVLDPLSNVLRVERASILYFERDYEGSVRHARSALALDPEFVLAFFNLGRSLGQLGRHDEAIAALEQGRALAPGLPALTMALGRAEKGGIVSLTDNASRAEFVAMQKTSRLFTLAFSKKADARGERFYLSSGDAKGFTANVKSGVATLDYDGLGEWPVHVTCTAGVKPGDSFVRWRIAVKVPDALILEEGFEISANPKIEVLYIREMLLSPCNYSYHGESRVLLLHNYELHHPCQLNLKSLGFHQMNQIKKTMSLLLVHV